jgi:hypothetical protein
MDGWIEVEGSARALAFGTKLARLPQPPIRQYGVANIQNNIATMLPDEIIAQLTAEFTCRDQQIRHLAALYSVRKFTRPYEHSTNSNPGASPISTLSKHPRPYSDWQILDTAIFPPFVSHTAHDYQCSRMHNGTASPGAHCCS